MENNSQDAQESSADEFLEEKVVGRLGVIPTLLNSFKSKQPVGQMNGHWATLFKFILVVTFFMTPTFFAWMVWSTTENFANQYNREKTQTISAQVEELHEDVTNFQSEVAQGLKNIGINEQKLIDLENRLQKLEIENKAIQAKISLLDGTNSSEHTKILVLLESIKTKMDIIHDAPPKPGD